MADGEQAAGDAHLFQQQFVVNEDQLARQGGELGDEANCLLCVLVDDVSKDDRFDDPVDFPENQLHLLRHPLHIFSS